MDAKVGFLVLVFVCLATASAAQGPRDPDQTLGQTAVDLFDFATPGNEIDSQEDVALFLMFLGILFFPSRYVFRKAFEYIEESLSDSTSLSSDQENYSSEATFTALSVSIGGALLVGGTIGYGVGVFLVLAAVVLLVSLGLIGSLNLSLPSITGPSDPSSGNSGGGDLGAANEELSEAVETASEARQELGDGNVEQALNLQRRCFKEIESEIEDIETELDQIHSQLQEVTGELESVQQQEENIQNSDLWGQLKNLNECLEPDLTKDQLRFLLEEVDNTYEELSNNVTGIDEVRDVFRLLRQANKTVKQAESLISESQEIIERSVDTLERIEERALEDQEQEAQSLTTKARGLEQKLGQLPSKVETIENQISSAFDQASLNAELLHENAERLEVAAERASDINSKLKDLGFRPEAARERTADDSHVAGFLERLEELEPKLRALAKVREEEARTLEQNS